MSPAATPIATPTMGSFSDNWEVFEAAVGAFDRGDYESGCRIATELLAHISTGDAKSRRWLLEPVGKLLLVESTRQLNKAA